MQTVYKKMFEFKVSEDELDKFRTGLRVAIESKHADVDGVAKMLTKLNTIAEGKHDWHRVYRSDD